MASIDRKRPFSLLLYPPDGEPRYFEVNRSLFKFFLLAPPFLGLICLVALGLGAVYFKQLRSGVLREGPSVIVSLRKEKTLLEAQLNQSRELNEELQRKLQAPSPSHAPGAFGSLSLFAPAQGRRDLTRETQLAIEDIQVQRNPRDTRFSFRITNLTQGHRRISGLVFVVLKTGDSYILWPSGQEGPTQRQFGFDEGEFFATSRFRPVEAIFPPLEEEVSPLFQVVIFSSTGDILYRKFYPEVLDN